MENVWFITTPFGPKRTGEPRAARMQNGTMPCRFLYGGHFTIRKC